MIPNGGGPILLSDFKAEIRAWADRIGVEPSEIHVRSMRRKWASCSSRGRLTFDPAMLLQPKRVRDEIIAHELLHLKIRNHGPLFKALLRSHLGRMQGSRERPHE